MFEPVKCPHPTEFTGFIENAARRAHQLSSAQLRLRELLGLQLALFLLLTQPLSSSFRTGNLLSGRRCPFKI